MEVTHHLSGAMIWLGQKAASLEDGITLSKKMIGSGEAWRKFLEIVERQEGDVHMLLHPDKYPKANFNQDVIAAKTGFVSDIDSLEVGLSAVQLGAGRLKWDDKIDPKAGIMVHKKIGDMVKAGEVLMTIFTDKQDVLQTVAKRLEAAVNIGSEAVDAPKMILDFLDKNSL